jgi:hypothetical protein
MNYKHILVSTPSCSVRLDVMNSDCFIHILEHPVMFKTFTWLRGVKLSLVKMGTSFVTLGSRFAGVRLLPFAVRYVTSTSCCPCIVGISQQYCYFVCRSLTGYLKLRGFWGQWPSCLQWKFLEWTSIVTFKWAAPIVLHTVITVSYYNTTHDSVTPPLAN